MKLKSVAPILSPPACFCVSVFRKFSRNLVTFDVILRPNREIEVSRNVFLSISRNELTAKISEGQALNSKKTGTLPRSTSLHD